MGQLWNKDGTAMEQRWVSYGIKMGQVWNKDGPVMEWRDSLCQSVSHRQSTDRQFTESSITKMGQLWNKNWPFTEQIWARYRTKMGQLWNGGIAYVSQ